MDPDRIRAVWAKHGLGRVRAIADASRGDVNRCFFVNGEAYVRVNVRDPDTRKFAGEALAYRLIAALTPELPVPRTVFVDEDRDAVPYDVIAVTALEGEDADLVWPRLSPAEAAAVSEEMGDFIGRLHTVRAEGIGYGPLHQVDTPPVSRRPGAAGQVATPPALRLPFADWRQAVEAEARRLLAGHASAGAVGPAQLAAIERWLAARLPVLPADCPPALVHNDFGPSNARLRRVGSRWRLSGVYDFEWAVVGDRHYEFRENFLRPDGDVWPEPFWHGYRGRQALADNFAERRQVYEVVYHLELLLVAAKHRGPGDDSYRFHRAALTRLEAPPAP